jgi:hypothetical protein
MIPLALTPYRLGIESAVKIIQRNVFVSFRIVTHRGSQRTLPACRLLKMEATFLRNFGLYNPGDRTFQSRPESLRANKSACIMQPRANAAAFLADMWCWLYNRTGALGLESESCCETAAQICACARTFTRREGRSAFSATSILGRLRFTLIYIHMQSIYILYLACS